MDISNEKISELLKNPEIVGMIASLASGFSSGKSNKEIVQETSESPEEKPLAVKEDTVEASSQVLPEISEVQDNSVMQFSKSSAYSDRRIALLQAIKPYVNDSKKDRVDSLVKAIGVAGILNNYAGGMLGGLFGKQ